MTHRTALILGQIGEHLSQLFRTCSVAEFVRILFCIRCHAMVEDTSHDVAMSSATTTRDTFFSCRQLVELATCFLKAIGGERDMFRWLTGGVRNMFSQAAYGGFSHPQAVRRQMKVYAKELFSNLLKTKGEHSSLCLLKNSSLITNNRCRSIGHHSPQGKQGEANRNKQHTGERPASTGRSNLHHNVHDKISGSLKEQMGPMTKEKCHQ